MTDAERMIAGYGGPLRERALAIAENILTMERSMDMARPEVEKQPPYVVEIVGDRKPHPVTRENRAWTGFRNLVKTHAEAVEKLNALLGESSEVSDDDPIEALMERVRDAGA